MNEETLTAPVVESPAVEPAAPETAPATQVVEQPQETTPNQVEVSGNQPQVPDTSRRKPSDYYRERQTIRELKEEVAALKKFREEQASANKPQAVVPEVPDFDPAHFSPEHKRILLAREKALRDAYDAKFAAYEQRLTEAQENKAQAETERKHQEALEKLFPKTSPDSNETLQQRIAKDPERARRIKDFLIESGLNEFSKVNPELAVEIALQKMGEKPKANPTILKKGLMGGNGTGNPGMGEKRSVGEQDLRAENKKINDQLDANPALRFDEKFMERRRQVMGEIERLVTKK